jgi:hypothetical protein
MAQGERISKRETITDPKREVCKPEEITRTQLTKRDRETTFLSVPLCLCDSVVNFFY